jgi:hypothetical protein
MDLTKARLNVSNSEGDQNAIAALLAGDRFMYSSDEKASDSSCLLSTLGGQLT